jgi:hypothetical protein
MKNRACNRTVRFDFSRQPLSETNCRPTAASQAGFAGLGVPQAILLFH